MATWLPQVQPFRFLLVLFFFPDNPSQVGSVSITIKVLDVNDNAPEFSRFYEAFVCENAKHGQVGSSDKFCMILLPSSVLSAIILVSKRERERVDH